jgi:hypothetical protein
MKLRGSFYLLFISLGLIQFIGCAGSMAPLLEKVPNCTSSLEGFYYCPESWQGEKPAMIVKEGSEYRLIKGKILSRDENSVEFDPKREGPFYDPEPRHFKFQEIEALIGNDGEIIYGVIPRIYSKSFDLELHLSPANASDKTIVKVKLKPNQRFAYCVKAGEYTVGEIFFIDQKKNTDRAVDFPKLTIKIEDNKSNYIGHLILNPQNTQLKNPIILPYKIVSRPEQATAAGILGGAIGGALHGMAMASKGIIGEHKLFIGMDKDFQPQGTMPLKSSILNVEGLND